MSQPDLSGNQPRGVLVRKPQSSIYTVLLLIALLALCIGSAIMAWEWLQYDLQYNPPANLRSAIGAAAPHSLLV